MNKKLNRKEKNMKQGSDRTTTSNINSSLQFSYVGFGQSLKKILLVFIGFSFLASCAYKPVVDTAGRSGTFNENKAHEITNDIQHCKKLAKNNTSFLGNIIYWIGSVEADTEYQALYRKCLINRGHSVLN
tara:strand:+ start:125 stop:514 length:390 start_codon:yes stop_codon:yes gene_type:complete